MKVLRRNKRMMAMILILSICIGMIPQKVFASEFTKYTFSKENCTISYVVTECWSTGYKVEVSIKNTSDSIIHDWKIAMGYENGTIDNIWNATNEGLFDQCLK